MKKSIIVLLALLLCISLCVPVFAAEEPTETEQLTFDEDMEPVKAPLLHGEDAADGAEDPSSDLLPIIIAVVAGVAVIAAVAVIILKKKK